MKKFILAVFFSISTLSLFAQGNRFRIDYDIIAILDQKTDVWSDWESGDNTFVFNVNDNKDVKHYKPNGTVAHYRNLSNDIEEGTANGYPYQIITVLDEDGTKCRLQIFDDPRRGLKLIYSNLILQFAKSN